MTLIRLYNDAEVPQAVEFLKGDRYKVIAFDGVPKLPCHYKYFALDFDNKRMYIPEGMVGGYNRSIIKWGNLILEDGEEYCIFRYKRWGIVDRVKRIADGLYIGEFYRKGEFKGYFLLMRED